MRGSMEWFLRRCRLGGSMPNEQIIEPSPFSRFCPQNAEGVPLFMMIVLFIVCWIFLYVDLVSYLTVIAIWGLSLFFMIYMFFLLIKKQFKKSLFYIAPILLAFLLGCSPLNIFISADTLPIKKSFYHSRHFIEFLIQKNIFNREMIDTEHINSRYKEWRLKKYSGSDYVLVYDVTDEIISHDQNIRDGCSYSVFKVDEHFYMLQIVCGIK